MPTVSDLARFVIGFDQRDDRARPQALWELEWPGVPGETVLCPSNTFPAVDRRSMTCRATVCSATGRPAEQPLAAAAPTVASSCFPRGAASQAAPRGEAVSA